MSASCEEKLAEIVAALADMTEEQFDLLLRLMEEEERESA